MFGRGVSAAKAGPAQKNAVNAQSNAAILVTGDVVLDHNLYAGERCTPDSSAETGLQHSAQPGGAMLTYGLLEALRTLPTKPYEPLPTVSVDLGLLDINETALKEW